MSKPQSKPKVAVNQINIQLNRKLMNHQIISQLRDTARAEGMLSGSAVMELLEEYDRMRYLIEGLVTAYERGDEAKVRKVLDVFRILT